MTPEQIDAEPGVGSVWLDHKGRAVVRTDSGWFCVASRNWPEWGDLIQYPGRLIHDAGEGL